MAILKPASSKLSYPHELLKSSLVVKKTTTLRLKYDVVSTKR